MNANAFGMFKSYKYKNAKKIEHIFLPVPGTIMGILPKLPQNSAFSDISLT